ncbi:MAG: efflux RND transporter periplasmic adaptor subunit [Bacteroidales bacterium]
MRNQFIVLTFVISCNYFMSSCKEKSEPERPVVACDKSSIRDVEVEGEYVGRIRANKHVEVRARVEGYLENMLFEEGKKVSQNAPLFIISQAQYKARLDKAKAQLKKDIAASAKATRDVERLRPLYEQNAASQLDLDNAIAAKENAEANAAMSQADLEQAELELGYTVVKSPISGYMSERHVDIGTLVGPGSKSLLATVVQSDTVLVDFRMTALEYQKSMERNVKLGHLDSTRSWQNTVEVTLADNSVYPLRGLVDFADPKVDPQTGTFTVRAILANPQQKLLPGQFTKVKLLQEVMENVVVIPRKALSIETGGAFVYVIRKDSTIEKRFVQSGYEMQNSIVIDRGLAADETIVTEGYHKLSSGIKVRPIRSYEESKNINIDQQP